eukprot:TRINITY_DN5581_c0_g1_i3.p1 TRINITY_DN5581_c0_g1~~TRINITY_DN5581_c0_g1_i3.p1  ORF type:complete len:740 (+),score=209.11 TRINITY_DN5581_c0_g1_i3:43-2262(+)
MHRLLLSQTTSVTRPLLVPLKHLSFRSYASASASAPGGRPVHDFTKILIANRGEIACRVMRTARAKGVKTVAVYSEADKNSLHVAMADEARLIGPPPAKESYLLGERIIQVAKETGAQAIHPGYGFLSENAEFAQQVEKSGLTFIGPPASAIRAMGSKSASKDIMIDAKVPTIPGYHGEDQTIATLQKEADKMGYPVIIKAVLGGGGKGMKIVERTEDLEEQVSSAIREAQSSFGDSRVLIEKYLRHPRHVEVQVFGDTHGNYVYLFERDCSVQRRHQKVIEEAPAPGLSQELREKLGNTAVAAARAVGYVGAGTVEFIMDQDGTFYFMEMNTRLQVEHPITEMVTGQDLVDWQLQVAAGHALPKQQKDLKLNGHSFEARIYAENPDADFLPGTGRLEHLTTPAAEEGHVRIETGVRQGDDVSVYYDPMIAKLVVWDTDRTTALKRLVRCLDEYHIVGLHTNVKFLKKLALHPAFIKGDVETGFIPAYRADLLGSSSSLTNDNIALAVLGLLIPERASLLSKSSSSSSPSSSSSERAPKGYGRRDPWASNGARVNHESSRTVKLLVPQQATKDANGVEQPKKDKEIIVDVTYKRDGTYSLLLPSTNTRIIAEARGGGDKKGTFSAFVDGRFFPSVRAVVHNDVLNVFEGSNSFSLNIPSSLGDLGEEKGSGSLLSPMPGKVVKVMAKKGDAVKKGQPLMIMEAMKMEHTIRSPGDGTVSAVHYAVGDLVEEKKALVVIA